MNERIRELAEQARKALATDAMSGGKFDMQAYEEKFAELIVKECADIAECNAGESNDEWDKCARYISAIIKKYLGAEQ